MAKVLISDALSPAAVAAFEARGIEVDVKTGLSESELIEVIPSYHGLAVRSATKVTARVLEAAHDLRVVGRAGIGVDNIDLDAATNRGVVVMNTPFGNSVTTAEHTIAMILALARQLPAADRSTRASKWEKSRFMGMELAGKVLGLIGCGNIGTIVADRAQGLRMRVIAYDPYLAPERAQDLGVEKVELEQLLARADVISLHTPLNDSTRNILSAAALAKTRPGVRIINCARGGLLDEDALHRAIVDGHVAGAALDAFAEEPARNSPLFDLEQVVVTPHLGASTVEAQEKVAVQIAEQMANYLSTGAVVNALNMPSVTAEEAPRLRPYMKLAGQLGSFAGQLTETGLRSATITYAGQVASLNTRPLTAALLQGLLAPLLESVNMVNAPLVARERNIAVTTIHQESIEGIFRGETINTPSMLAVEDALDGLRWAEGIGGLAALIARSESNLQAVAAWVEASAWADFLAERPGTRSSTSICLKISDPAVAALPSDAQANLIKDLVGRLAEEGVAHDIASYRDAPPGLRLWGGATVERDDLDALLPWLDWAFEETRTRFV
jgi:D-3-phosphoglycerate dehydrogenase